MGMNNQDIIEKLRELESVVQQQDTSSDDLKQIVEELKGIVQSLDKTMAIQVEKQSHLNFRIEMLQKELDELETKGDKGNDRHRILIENALMAVLGGLLTYIFNLGHK